MRNTFRRFAVRRRIAAGNGPASPGGAVCGPGMSPAPRPHPFSSFPRYGTTTFLSPFPPLRQSNPSLISSRRNFAVTRGATFIFPSLAISMILG